MPERKARARAAVQASSQRIEKMLGDNHAYRKVEDGLYAVKQGTSMIMIKVHPWKDHSLVRLVAQLVKGVTMECTLAVELLQLNAVLRFREFAFVADEYDDRIAARYGGQTMEDLMEESVIAHVRQAGGPDPG